MSGSQSNITSLLCERIVSHGAGKLDARLMPAARQLFLDGLAVAVAGAQLEPAPRILFEHFVDPLTGAGERPCASLLGMNARIGTVQAALVNGASMHVLDFEPMWLPATHALSPALSAALALGETAGSNGLQILTAMVLGIEIQGRIRAAAMGPPEDVKFHPPGILGPIGAAVAAGHLMGFNTEQFANAIGIAGSRCGGLFVNLGTMTKSSHCGYAAALGLEAALLTGRGFTGSLALFEPGPQSYAEAFFPNGFAADSLLDFGEPFRISDPGFTIKMFPAKFSTHYAITAALAVRPQVLRPDAIRKIRITAADVPSSNRPHPRSGLDGKFSLQYTTAITLLDGNVDFDSFTDDRLARSDVQTLLGKIETKLSPDIPGLYTAGRYLDLEIEMEDGKIIRERCERPRGSWGSEPITKEEHLGKARSCLKTYLTSESVDTCIEMCENIDTLDTRGVRNLLHLVSTGEDVQCC